MLTIRCVSQDAKIILQILSIKIMLREQACFRGSECILHEKLLKLMGLESTNKTAWPIWPEPGKIRPSYLAG